MNMNQYKNYIAQIVNKDKIVFLYEYITTHIINVDKIKNFYEYFHKEDLFHNIIGIFIGGLFIFGILSMQIIFNLLSIGLLLYSIREVIRLKTKSIKKNDDLYELLYFWISLIFMRHLYNFMEIIINIFTGYFFIIILNLIYMYIFTNIINKLTNTNIILNFLEPLNIKEAEKIFEKETNEKEKINIGIITKLYSINSVLIDNFILKYGSNVTSNTFNFIYSSSKLLINPIKISYNYLTTKIDKKHKDDDNAELDENI